MWQIVTFPLLEPPFVPDSFSFTTRFFTAAGAAETAEAA